MIYDNQHKSLLQDDWKWNGTEYTRDFSVYKEDREGLLLKPSSAHDTGTQKSRIEYERRHSWDLKIHILDPVTGQYGWSRVCSFDNFCTAAKAVLGNC